MMRRIGQPPHTSRAVRARGRRRVVGAGNIRGLGCEDDVDLLALVLSDDDEGHMMLDHPMTPYEMAAAVAVVEYGAGAASGVVAASQHAPQPRDGGAFDTATMSGYDILPGYIMDWNGGVLRDGGLTGSMAPLERSPGIPEQYSARMMSAAADLQSRMEARGHSQNPSHEMSWVLSGVAMSDNIGNMMADRPMTAAEFQKLQQDVESEMVFKARGGRGIVQLPPPPAPTPSPVALPARCRRKPGRRRLCRRRLRRCRPRKARTRDCSQPTPAASAA